MNETGGVFTPKNSKRPLKIFTSDEEKEIKHHSFGEIEENSEFEPIIKKENFKTFIVKDTTKDEFWTRLEKACFSH